MQQGVVVGLDFETYSPVDIRTHGLDGYFGSPFFKPLIGSLKYKNGGVSLDFIKSNQDSKEKLDDHIRGNTVAAHNVEFEYRVLKSLGMEDLPAQYVDTAVVSRVAGGASSLAAAGAQLLNWEKLEGGNLIKLFSVPSKEQLERGDLSFQPQVASDNSLEWLQFHEYCTRDAEMCFRLVEFERLLTAQEMKYMECTMNMNRRGWPVDVALVKKMQERYEKNMEDSLRDFRLNFGASDLNLNSLKQLKQWCADRGVRASSFDEKHVMSMILRLRRKLDEGKCTIEQYNKYTDVIQMLRTKQELGGSSLKKLQTILDHVGSDGRLRNQYMHAGAGQTLRTSGKTVQLQNLKRLSTPMDMDLVHDDSHEFTNSDLAVNLRQVFTSSDPNGKLIVGDFSSVESRGLAYLANEDWKLDAYRKGQDLYKVLATTMFKGVGYDQVTKQQRQTGKVGELSCGYGAGPGAVKEFAKNMGVELSEGETTALVHNWREANPNIVWFWKALDYALDIALATGGKSLPLPHGMRLHITEAPLPVSLAAIHSTAKTLTVELYSSTRLVMRRLFHGCHMRGRNICYYRPSDRKTGQVWSKDFVNPKTKQRQNYTIYGGKLAGILTQSFCRELFFDRAMDVELWTSLYDNVELIGQFHDELVLNWTPFLRSGISLDLAVQQFKDIMSDAPSWAARFPLAAEVNFDYRYTK